MKVTKRVEPGVVRVEPTLVLVLSNLTREEAHLQRAWLMHLLTGQGGIPLIVSAGTDLLLPTRTFLRAYMIKF